jgi:hypothetical protein
MQDEADDPRLILPCGRPPLLVTRRGHLHGAQDGPAGT